MGLKLRLTLRSLEDFIERIKMRAKRKKQVKTQFPSRQNLRLEEHFQASQHLGGHPSNRPKNNEITCLVFSQPHIEMSDRITET